MPIGPREAQIEITADSRKLDRGLKESRSKLRGFGQAVKGIGSAIGKGFAKAGSFLARSFDPLGRGFDLFASQIDDVRTYERGIARLAIAQGKSNDQMGDFRVNLDQISRETGVHRNEVLQGVAAYQALTGDTKGASDAAKTFARVSQATGSTVQDVADTAAALSQNLKISPSDFEKAFSVLNTQGKAGAVELKDLAAEAAALSPQFARFAGGTGLAGMTKMGAAVQIIRRNFSTASEAGTGFRSLMTAITRNAKQLEKAGVKVFTKDPKTGKKELRDFGAIVESIGKSKLMKDPTKLTKALGSSEAERSLLALTSNWSDFQGLINTTDFSSIGKDFDQYLASPAGRMDQAWNNVKLAAAEALTPERIEKAASAMEKLASVVDLAATAFDRLEEASMHVFGNEENLLSPETVGRGKSTQVGAPVRAEPGIIEAFTEGDHDIGRQLANAGGQFEGQSFRLAEQNKRQREAEEAARRLQVFTPAGAAIAAGTQGDTRRVAAESQHQIAADMRRLVAELTKLKVVVQVDGDAIAKAQAGSRQHRRRPGG
jgi:TP901 family phage tail tape measure protein